MNEIEFASFFIKKNDPFYGSVLCNINLHEDNSQPTLCTDCHSYIKYNSEFAKKNGKANTLIFLYHELEHIIRMHNHQIHNVQHHHLMNIAMDFVINNNLEKYILNSRDIRFQNVSKSSKFTKINFSDIVKRLNREDLSAWNDNSILLDMSLSKLTSMQIYQKLLEQVDTSNSVNVEYISDIINSSDDLSKDEIMFNQKNMIVSAVETSRKCGQGSVPIVNDIQDLLKPQVSWRNVVKNWLTTQYASKISLQRPHYVSQSIGTFIRGSEPDKTASIAFVCDQSGSMTDYDRQICLSEMMSFCKELKLKRIEFICFDHGVTQHQTFKNEQPVKPVFKGCGGTVIQPAFDLVKELKVDGVIVVTDGYLADWEPLPLSPNKMFYLITQKGGGSYLPKELQKYYAMWKK